MLEEPGAGEAEFAIDGGFRGGVEFGGFFGGTAEEVALFEHGCLVRVAVGEGGEQTVEVDDFGAGGVKPGDIVVEWDVGEAGATFGALRGTGVVDEGAAHEQGAEVVEMLAAF